MTGRGARVQPIVLDFDASVAPLSGERRIDLRHWQEAVRFACSRQRLDALRVTLEAHLPHVAAPVFMGSGDFHHVSATLIARVAARSPCRVVVFDNHPDNMRFPFGIHCGSWVAEVAGLKGVSHVDVVGITSSDIAAARLWENYLAPLYRRKVTYWSLRTRLDWIRRIGLGAAYRTFATRAELLEAFTSAARDFTDDVYVSIDKDVLSEQTVTTNWDQGDLTQQDLLAALDALLPRMIAMDVTGDVSLHTYATAWKRWLSARDAQPQWTSEHVAAAQSGQHAVNVALLDVWQRSRAATR